MSDARCVFCKKFLSIMPMSVVSSKGLATIRAVSAKRKDDIADKLKNVEKSITVHTKCRKEYTKRVPKSENVTRTPATPRVERRRKSKLFQYKNCCLFCDDFVRRWDKVSIITTSPDFDNKLAEVSQRRNDPWGFKILGRIEAADGNLQSKGARYHRSCLLLFYDLTRATPSKIPKIRKPLGTANIVGRSLPLTPSTPRPGRPCDPAKSEWFKSICKHIEENSDCQFSITELSEMGNESKTYGEKHLKRLLLQKYPSQLHFTLTHFTFTGTAAKILNSEWYRNRRNNDMEERLRIVRTAAAIIREDIRAPVYNVDVYPSIASMAAGGAELVPATLRQFVDDVVKTGKRGKDLAGVDRKCVAVCLNTIAVTRPYSFLSPLHVSLGIDLERRYGSRALIDLLSSIGTCSSYSEVKRFESSVVTTSQPVVSEECFVQFVMDNADFNVRTLTGHGTFHVMGAILCVTPADGVQAETQIPRKGVSILARDKVRHGTIPIKAYRPIGASGLEDVIVRNMQPDVTAIQALRPFTNIDLIWLAGRTFENELCPGWSGFMEVAAGVDEALDTTAIIPLPFINLQASNPSAIYTGLHYAADVCDKRGQSVCIVTFDQPLFQKASEITLQAQKSAQLSSVIVRLGTFHLNMSFLLAIGKIMAGSGLEELLATVYAKSTVAHMLLGKAYSRSVRGHLLAQAAVFGVLLEEECNSLVKNDAIREFNALFAGATTWSESLESPAAEALREEAERIFETTKGTNRTASLWCTYYEMVSILKASIAAERLGDWHMHLAAVRSMLPFFHSAGCLNYARSAHLYLQQVDTLHNRMSPRDYSKYVTSRYFSLRHKKKVWSGNETDKTIEQRFMKFMKGTGGFTRGRGTSDSTLAAWIHAAPVCSEVRGAVEQFTGTSTSTSDQHTDLRERSKELDREHFLRFKAWLLDHNPFSQEESGLVALASGAVADSSINCDKAKELGLISMQKMEGRSFAEVKLSRKDCLRPLSAMKNSVRIGEDLVTPVNINLLFHRMILLLKKSDDKELEDAFAFELAPWPASLFDDSGFMRVGQKSKLVSAIESYCRSDSNMPDDPHYVVDGGFLLRVLVWPRPATYGDILQSYRNYMKSHYKEAVVVFDGYEHGPQTKDEAHMRRSCKVAPEIIFQEGTVCTTPQMEFLANPKNKVRLIQALTAGLREDGLTVIQAPADADTLIVQTALMEDGSSVIVGNDSDLLAILVGTSTSSSSAHLLVPGTGNKPYTVHHGQNIIESLPDVSGLLPFLHASLGCDTTSNIFNRSKKKAMDKLKKDPTLRHKISAFNDPTTSKHDLAISGEEFLLALYGMAQMSNLNEARVRLYKRYVLQNRQRKQNFNIATLPPTSEAASLHFFRVFHQVQTWRGVALNPTEWGWKIVGGKLRPIPSERQPAPECLLRVVYCNCRSGCGRNCECSRHGLLCSDICGHCAGTGCSNSEILVPEDDQDPQASSNLEDPNDPDDPPPTATNTDDESADETPGEEYDVDSDTQDACSDGEERSKEK